MYTKRTTSLRHLRRHAHFKRDFTTMHTVENRVRSTLQGVAVRVKSVSYLTKVPMLYKLTFIKLMEYHGAFEIFLSLYFVSTRRKHVHMFAHK